MFFEECFLKNHDDLSNLGKGSPKEHCCHIMSKSVQYFMTRKILKVFYLCRAGK